MPPYFTFLMLVAFRAFLAEKVSCRSAPANMSHRVSFLVDVAIVEVGIGGAFDSTNIIRLCPDMFFYMDLIPHGSRNPVVCGITTLDLDHTDILGETICHIAWQKSGIFKVIVAYQLPIHCPLMSKLPVL